jgi:hypothetical protein
MMHRPVNEIRGGPRRQHWFPKTADGFCRETAVAHRCHRLSALSTPPGSAAIAARARQPWCLFRRPEGDAHGAFFVARTGGFVVVAYLRPASLALR